MRPIRGRDAILPTSASATSDHGGSMRRWYYAVPLIAAGLLGACSDQVPTDPHAAPVAVGGLGQVAGAGYTTFVDPAACRDGSAALHNDVDCNNYASKDGVYMSGGPASGNSALSDGTYFFAVLNPGGQNVLTGTAGQMDFVRSGTPALPRLSSDARDCRTFGVSGGVVTYDNTTYGSCSAPHATGVTPYSAKFVVQLMPYDDTQNNGGVYILAVCRTSVTSASECKYDAFRIRTAEECPGGDCGPDLNPVLSGYKYYDANMNGQFDATEEGIPGWNINVGASTTTTGPGGLFSSTVDPGTLTVTEQLAGNGWVQTGNTVDQTSSTLNTVFLGPTGTLPKFAYSVVAVFNGSTSYLNFGNVCSPTPGGHTLGFWSNKNGQALITANDLSALSAFNLIQPKSSSPYYQAFDPTTKAALATWLLSGTATNMSYMLGVQMTATYLGLQHGFTTNVNVDNAPAILAGYAPPRNVTQEIAYANALLGAYPYTVASGSVRTELGRVKSLFDTINNSQSLLQSTLTDGIAVCGAPSFQR